MPRVALIWYAHDQAWPVAGGPPAASRFSTAVAWIGRVLHRKHDRPSA